MKIRDVIRLIENEGWYLIRTGGSHRQYKHSVKSGCVTIARHAEDDLAPYNVVTTLPDILSPSTVTGVLAFYFRVTTDAET